MIEWEVVDEDNQYVWLGARVPKKHLDSVLNIDIVDIEELEERLSQGRCIADLTENKSNYARQVVATIVSLYRQANQK